MTTEEILDWFTRHLVVRESSFQSGPYGRLEMIFVIAEPPNYLSETDPMTYTLCGPGNSYMEACIGEIGLMLDEAKRLLGKPTTADAAKRAAAIVTFETKTGIAKG